ncbi:MAG: 4Fe-4S binding protein [Chlamydiota bacterium]
MKEFIRRWFLSSVVVVVISLGWKYPFLGFSVPIVMLGAVSFGFFKNRYFCGHLCPRGSFFDHWISLISRKKRIPRWLFSSLFRWTVLFFLMGFMGFRLFFATDLYSVGRVFWMMCAVTTGIGIFFGIWIHPRMWCSFCPIGTLQKIFSSKKTFLTLDTVKCKSCRLCEKKCPLQLPIIDKGKEGLKIVLPDCMRCEKCIHACSVRAISGKNNANFPK